jgi:hypothetical protein
MDGVLRGLQERGRLLDGERPTTELVVLGEESLGLGALGAVLALGITDEELKGEKPERKREIARLSDRQTEMGKETVAAGDVAEGFSTLACELDLSGVADDEKLGTGGGTRGSRAQVRLEQSRWCDLLVVEEAVGSHELGVVGAEVGESGGRAANEGLGDEASAPREAAIVKLRLQQFDGDV